MRKGRNTFTGNEAKKIRELLRQKIQSGNLKSFRDQLRRLEFYITDFSGYTYGGFSVDDFDHLVKNGRIAIID